MDFCSILFNKIPQGNCSCLMQLLAGDEKSCGELALHGGDKGVEFATCRKIATCCILGSPTCQPKFPA